MERLRNKPDTLSRNSKTKLALLMAAVLAMNVVASCGSSASDSIKETSETIGDAELELPETETVEIGVATEIYEAIDAIGTEEISESIEAETETEMENVLETECGGTEVSQMDSSMSSSAGTETESQSSDGENNEADSSYGTDDTVSSYTVTSLNKTMYAKQAVNVRSLPSTDGSKMGALSKGESVSVTGQCNETGWYRIIYKEQTGYCSNNYLTDIKPEENSSSVTLGGADASSDGGASGNSSSGAGSGSSGSTGGGAGSSGSSGSCSDSSAANNLNSVSDSSVDVSDEEDEEDGFPEVTDELLAEYAQEVIELTNKERKAAGLSALKVNTILMECAQIRAEELVELFDHTRPDGSDCMTVLPEEYGCIEGSEGTENIAYGTWTDPERAVELWMDSPLHCGNILDEDIDEIGVGVYFYNDDFYYVQIFTNGFHKHTWPSETEDIVFGSLGGEEITCYVCEYDKCQTRKRASDGSLIK